jgi:hypothetical protein
MRSEIELPVLTTFWWIEPKDNLSIKNVISGLYYKQVTIVNDNSSTVSKLSSKLIDDARVVIYDCNMFIIQVTGR